MPTIPTPPYSTLDKHIPGWLEWFRTHKHRPITRFLFPSSFTVHNGTHSGGTIADVATLGGNQLVITEVAGTPGFMVDLLFSPTTVIRDKKPIGVVMRSLYDGSTAHSVVIQSWDYINAGLVNHVSLPTTNGYYWDFSYIFTNPAYFYNNTTVPYTVRFNHISAGTPGHILRIDYCALMYLEDE